MHQKLTFFQVFQNDGVIKKKKKTNLRGKKGTGKVKLEKRTDDPSMECMKFRAT